jgi:hypothetical protein
MAPSDKSLLERALIDRKHQAFELTGASRALCDLGLDIYHLPDGEQKTRMIGDQSKALEAVRKLMSEATLVRDMIERKTHALSTNGASEREQSRDSPVLL